MYIVINKCRKVFDKINIFYSRKLNMIQESYRIEIMIMYDKFIVNILLNGEIQKNFFLKLGLRRGWLVLLFLFSEVFGILVIFIELEKGYGYI